MKLLRETWLFFVSYVKATLRSPSFLFLGLFQPACWLFLFAPLLKGITEVLGFPTDGALNNFTPGVLILMGMFGSAFAGFGLIADLRQGLIERLRVTPVSRLAPLLGRSLRDVVVLLIQSAILLLLAWPLGLQVGLGGILTTLGLLAIYGLLMSSCSYGLALTVKDENAFAPITNFFTLPLLLLSGIILPLTLAPDWLQSVSVINPLKHAVDAARMLFAGHFGDTAVLRGFAVTSVLALLALWWTARSFRNATM